MTALARLLKSTVFRRALAIVLLMAAVAAAVIGLVGWRANAILTRSVERAIEADAAELRSDLVSRGIDGLAQMIDDRSRARGGGVYLLLGSEGQRRSGNLQRLPDWPPGARRGVFRYSPEQSDQPAASRLAAGLLIDIDGEPRLVVGRDIEAQHALLQSIYRSIATGAAVLFLIGLVGSFLLSRHVLGRLDEMSQASGRIMSGDLSGRIPIDGSDDELDRLAIRLNEMLTRIEELMAGLREVSDNIAHDLKTPLNRLRNRAEAALADGGGAVAWRSGLERVIDEADELIKTFNALLLIARLEAGGSIEREEAIDLAQLVSDVAELYEPVVEEAGFRLVYKAPATLPVRGNKQLLGQALANLIDNALKYATDGRHREISITAERRGDAALLAVADRGPGIAPENRDRALKRFVRLEQSRSLPGTGLGLSLVGAVVRLHGGSVSLEDNAPGLRVVLSLPLAPAAAVVASSGAVLPRVTELERG